jgi:hypothetical protein
MRWCKIPLHSLFYLIKYIEKLLIKLEIVCGQNREEGKIGFWKFWKRNRSKNKFGK